ncbi:MAG TPA: response regulator [Opitutales bacterium]|nr:response regulator [Opitutales bacterium]
MRPIYSQEYDIATCVGDLPHSTAKFNRTARGVDIRRYFEKQPEAPGAIITDEGALVVAFSQTTFLRVLSRPYGVELFYLRPIESLIECANHAPMLLLPAGCGIEEAVERCLARPADDLYEPFLVKDEQTGAVQMVVFQNLLLAASRLAALRNQQLAAEVAARQETEKHLRAAQLEAEAASRAKSEFVANMSHEIRTPMNGILGMTELALGTELTAEQREYLTLVQQSGHSLLGIINDILDFSKIEARMVHIEEIPFGLRETIADLIKPLGVRAAQKSLELVADIPAMLPNELIGDPLHLRQVLVNLLGNAIKFTERGEIVLEVRLLSQANGSVNLRFAVKDTGIGIPPDKQSSIFSPFTQADSSTTRRFGGTGLGLAISKGLLEKMNGRLTVQSEPGRGSCFEFTLSLRCSAAIPRAGALPREQLRGLRALIVDDNHVNRRILQEMTRHWGMLPTPVEGGQAALAELEHARQAGYPYHLILLDAMMPEMDGFMLAQELARLPEATRATIIMLSSVAQAGEAERARRLGIASVLTKPITQAELLKSVLDILGQMALTGTALATGREGAATALRVLLVEDNEVNQQVARRLLTQRGHEVVVACNGLEAVAAVQTAVFDIILMDIQMPEMDGLEATVKIREYQHAHGVTPTPIIALTAKAMNEDRARFLAAGMEAHLAKPFTRAELIRHVEQLAQPAAHPA